jgi:NDP-sugar pyrophosphorylase family protein
VFNNIEKLKVQNIFISVHYLKEQIHDFLKKTKRKNKVKVLSEKIPLGTAGSLKLLPSSETSNILVVNGDILTTLDFEALINFHSKNNSDATIAVANHLVKIPYGVIRHDSKGNFLNLEEKPNINNYVSAGIYCLSNKLLKLLNIKEYIDMPELLNRAKKKGMNIMIFPIHENWTDIGRPKDLIKARKK